MPGSRLQEIKRILHEAIKAAEKLAKKYKKPFTAGSDAHFLSEFGNAYVEFDDSLTLRQAILKNKISYHHKSTFFNALINRTRSLFKIIFGI